MSFPQKYRAVCDSLQKQYGGGITKTLGREVFKWYIKNLDGVTAFLRDILPYSTEKREQIELVLNMPVNGAPDVAEKLRPLKGNQGAEPKEKAKRVAKIRLHGLPRCISILKKSNDEPRGYKVTHKGVSKRFVDKTVTLEDNLEAAKALLEDMKKAA